MTWQQQPLFCLVTSLVLHRLFLGSLLRTASKGAKASMAVFFCVLSPRLLRASREAAGRRCLAFVREPVKEPRLRSREHDRSARWCRLREQRIFEQFANPYLGASRELVRGGSVVLVSASCTGEKSSRPVRLCPRPNGRKGAVLPVQRRSTEWPLLAACAPFPGPRLPPETVVAAGSLASRSRLRQRYNRDHRSLCDACSRLDARPRVAPPS